MSRAFRSALLLACIVARVGDAQQPPAACFPVDTAGLDDDRLFARDDSTLGVVRDSLERRLRQSDTTAPLLLALGRAAAVAAPDSQYAAARPNEYFYNEIGGGWLYRGWHFEELRRRFPNDSLADDAAHEITRLPMGGECEGFIPCYVHVGFGPVAEFLGAYPQSPLAHDALRRALAAFSRFAPDLDLRQPSEYVDTADVRRLVSELDSLGRALPPSLGVKLIARAAELWEQMGELRAARETFALAASLATPDVRDCLAARAAAVPASALGIESPRVVHTRRVELRWAAMDTAAAYVVYRAPGRDGPWAQVAEVPRTAVGWTDTSLVSGVTYWYRVAARTGGGERSSLAVRADVPTDVVQLEKAAVSTRTGHLYLFGYLGNGFPTVIQVSPRGEMSRNPGFFFHRPSAPSVGDFRRYLREQWIVPDNGIGVLRFAGTPPLLPNALRSAVRAGVSALQQVADSSDQTLTITVDEAAGAAWVTYRAVSLQTGSIITADCSDRVGLCWMATPFGPGLYDLNATLVAPAPTPAKGWGDVAAVYLDVIDASGWISMPRQGRLVHVGRRGAILHDLQLVDPRRAYGLSVAPDLQHKAIWYTAPSATGATELVRIDLESPTLTRRTTPLAQSWTPAYLLPDQSGGVWLATRRGVTRFDRNGRTIVTVELPGAR
jgi:hypothetical protein